MREREYEVWYGFGDGNGGTTVRRSIKPEDLGLADWDQLDEDGVQECVDDYFYDLGVGMLQVKATRRRVVDRREQVDSIVEWYTGTGLHSYRQALLIALAEDSYEMCKQMTGDGWGIPGIVGEIDEHADAIGPIRDEAIEWLRRHCE